MATETTEARKTLVVTQMGKEMPLGDKSTKQTFKARDEQGEEIWYEAVRDTVKAEIGVGAKFDCTVQTRINTKGDKTYVDRRVTEIHQSIAQAVPNSSGGPANGKPGGGYTENPETRASIEAQQAAKYVTDVQVAAMASTGGISPGFATLIDLKDKWCKKALIRALGAPLPISPGQSPTADQTAQTEAARTAIPSSQPVDAVSRQPIPESETGGNRYENIGLVFTEAAKHGISRAVILKHLDVAEKDVPKLNPDETWAIVYTDLVKKEATE